MKRRSKLDLSAAAKGGEKHQAEGFEQFVDRVSATADADPVIKPAKNSGSERPGYLAALIPDPATRRILIKTAAVVAVAAVTVFLLKRR